MVVDNSLFDGKRVLVTGGAGFIGSNIAEYLLKNTNALLVRVFDNLSTGYLKNIEPFYEFGGRFEFVRGDLRNFEDCQEVMKVNEVDTVDMISHQGALGSVPRSINDPMASHMSNANGTFNILLAAHEAGVKRVVYASSSSVYGDDTTLPKIESSVGKTKSPYASTKTICEEYGHIFATCYGMEIIGCRYFNVFGPRQDPNGAYAAVIPKFIGSVLNQETAVINGDGHFSRDFTYVKNIVEANVLAMTHQLSSEQSFSDVFGRAYNIGAGGRTSIIDLYDMINHEDSDDNVRKVEYRQIRDGDIPHSHANIDLARATLRYDPQVQIKEGIGYTYNYYKQIAQQ